MTTADAVQTIVRVVSPYVGETTERLEALLSRLGCGLNIFLGREKSSRVVNELRQAMSGEFS